MWNNQSKKHECRHSFIYEATNSTANVIFAILIGRQDVWLKFNHFKAT